MVTRWSSHTDQAADQWFQVDMSGLRTFDRVVLDDGQFGPQPKPYEVFASDRGFEVLVCPMTAKRGVDQWLSGRAGRASPTSL